MALGYCNGCGKLVTITPNGWAGDRPESRRQKWFPVQHDGNDGKPCNGVSKPL